MRTHRIYIGLVLLSLTACQSRNTTQEVEAEEVTHITALPDSSFFSDLRQLTLSGDRLYALDVDRRQVLSLSKDFTDLQLFGSGGRGPGELLAPFSFALEDDSVLIADVPSQAIKSYGTDGYLGMRAIDFLPDDYRWYAKGEIYLMPLRNADSLIVCCSPDGDRFFGGLRRFGSDKKTSIMNTCSVLNYGENLLAIYMMLPYARLYSPNGQLKKEIDLSGAEFYGQNMAYISSKPTKENSAYILHQDAVVSNSKLYLLCPRYGKQFLVDRILEIDIRPGHLSRIIRLPEGVYGSIAIEGDSIYAFNSRRCSLDLLKIRSSAGTSSDR